MSRRKQGTSGDRPVVAGGDEAGAFLVAGVVLGRLYDKLKSIFHREEHRNRKRRRLGAAAI